MQMNISLRKRNRYAFIIKRQFNFFEQVALVLAPLVIIS